MTRSAARTAAAATICLFAGAASLAGGQSAQDPQRPPVFRTSTNLITVDAYPRLNGRIVEGLTPADFEIVEDGTAQAIDQFEFVRIQPTPEAARVDPNNQRDMLQQAADPHNRVFVTYLDVYHTSVVGSHDIRQPLINMLNQIVAPNDLFGVITSKMAPPALVLGRRMLSVEEQLSRYWPWGERQRAARDPDDAKEDYLDTCFKGSPVEHQLADHLIERRREESTLANLHDLVVYVGRLREARTSVIAITDGWKLFRPDATLVATLKQPGLAPVGVNEAGRLRAVTGLETNYSEAACASEFARLALLDNDKALHDIIALANRTNVVFYPVNAGGLEVFDTNISQTQASLVGDMSRHRDRVDSVLTLANNTDGIAIAGTNDLRAGLSRIVNDVSAYYLLGYYSTNPKPDGKFRQIKVRVKQNSVAVVARRGYVATAPAPAGASTEPSAARSMTDVSEGLATIARLADATTELFTYGVVSGKDLAVVAEIASGQLEIGKWSNGGAVKVSATGPSGETVGTAAGTIEPGTRSVLVRLPVDIAKGPWKVVVTITGTSGELTSRIDVRPGTNRIIADPILYRGNAAGRLVLRPVADFLYRRTERVHVECPILKPLDERSVRVLDRRGQPVAIQAVLTEREENGQSILVADLNLAPLSPEDYVLEISVGSGGEKQRRQIGVHLVR